MDQVKEEPTEARETSDTTDKKKRVRRVSLDKSGKIKTLNFRMTALMQRKQDSAKLRGRLMKEDMEILINIIIDLMSLERSQGSELGPKKNRSCSITDLFSGVPEIGVIYLFSFCNYLISPNKYDYHTRIMIKSI